jgi:hypothetical protein
MRFRTPWHHRTILPNSLFRKKQANPEGKKNPRRKPGEGGNGVTITEKCALLAIGKRAVRGGFPDDEARLPPLSGKSYTVW